LTIAEVQTLATVIGLSGGSMVFSDDLTSLSSERLQLAARFLPPLSNSMLVLDWLQDQYPCRMRTTLKNDVGEWHLLAQINWADKVCSVSLPLKTFGLPDGNYWISDFWNQQIHQNNESSSLGEFNISAHGCLLLAVRPAQNEKDQYLGSELHFSQGIEVKKWTNKKKETRFVLDLHRRTSGLIYLSIPSTPMKIESSHDILDFEKVNQSIYKLHVQVDAPLAITIKH